MQLSKTDRSKIIKHVEGFEKDMKAASQRVISAANHYVSAIKIHKDAMQIFHDKYPTVPNSVWSGFCRIAEGELHPRLLFDGTAGGHALKRCDIVTQNAYIDDGVPVLTSSGDVLLVAPQKMTSEQARQVFNNGVVRDTAEQRAWIETQKSRAAIKRPQVDVTNDVFVKGHTLHVGKVKLTRAELLKYLAQMEG